MTCACMGHIQRADGFVGDNQLGVHYNGARYADALALAAGELMRIAPRVLTHQAHHLKHLKDLSSMTFLSFSPRITRPSAMISCTVMRGSNEAIGSWKIIWI